MPSKKRKSAHVLREGLNEELRRLREQLKQLNPIAGLGSENAAIFRAIRQQQLNLASAQSAILPLLQTSGFAQNLHPLHSQIRLGKSWETTRNDTMGRRCGPIDAQRVVLEAVGDFSIVFIRFGLHQEELFDKFANERVTLRNVAANFDDCFQNDYIIIPGVPATISKLSTTNAVHAPNPSFQFV
ncbi:uncharacterized protein IUM83_06539 [Phytophthora cinnamomi]|uniref:uncharacterized protein n=1 Tax=Phytophthora cinnamomi TaxID=4785 RepID=UPI00355959E5|nr:hypothetical protein IUM83_06539 [Phytophthora cinnamomi]